MRSACTSKNTIEMTLEKIIYPSKKELGIHIVITKNMSTARNLANQHPSWKIDAAVFRVIITHSTTKWKQKRVKLILIMAEGPIHASVSPEASGHCRK